MTRFVMLVVYVFAWLLGSTVAGAAVADSVAKQDTVRMTRSSSTDTIVVISASDSARLRIKSKHLRLRGEAQISYRSQEIQAEVIEVDFGTSTLAANGTPDSTGRITGFPVFVDQGTEFAGESMTYNFETSKGRVQTGETSVEGGFYYGETIKRAGDSIAYVQDGCFTTCDAPHPHFYFNSPRMKVVMNDRLFLDPVIWYVEDIPVFALPFGLFFSIEQGRRSGIIMPSPLVTSDRGVVLQNAGYYFAVSDYFDTEVAADITTKGGFTLYNRSQWNVLDVMRGSAELRFGYTRFNVEDPYQLNLGVTMQHQQQLGPNQLIAAQVQFTTQRLFQNTSLNPVDRLQQNARSNASYQRTFFNGMTLNATYSRDQNIITSSVSQTPSVSFGVPQFFPFRNAVKGQHWLRDVTMTYRSTGRYTQSAQRNADTGAFATTEYTVIEHRPTITVTPKLGYFTIQPSVSYSENWYLQQYTQSVNPSDSTVSTIREGGFFREYTYSAGVSASTFLYGTAYPRILGIGAIRHTMQPVIGLQFAPDQTDPALGFFGEYVSAVTGETVRYRRFGAAGGLANESQQARITMNLLNKISVKPLPDNDTVAPRPIDLLTINLSTSYNVAADSLRLAPISVGLRTPVLEALEFNLNGTFNPYDQALVADPATGLPTWRTINTTMLEAGKGLARLTNVTVNLGSRFSSQGLSFAERSIVRDTTATKKESADLRSRFGDRLNAIEEESDLFGDRGYGWSPVIVPWEVSANLTYSMNAPTPTTTIQSLFLAVRGSFSVTETIDVNVRGSFDLLTGELNSPIIDITKRIHCWNLTLNWVPSGANQGFFLRFSAAAPQLQGLVIPKQSTPLYR